MKIAIAKTSAWLLALAVAASGFAGSLPRQDQSSQTQQPGQQHSSKQDSKKKKSGKSSDNAQGNSQGNAQSGSAAASPPASNPPANSPPPKPAPLFGGTLNLKSSRQTRDSATLGFNGVGPDGQVEKSMLAAAPTGMDNAKAAQVASYKVADADVSQFIQDGGLAPAPPMQKTSN